MPPPSSSTSTVVAGRYQIGDLLGRGGMAEVRAGTDLRLQRQVAVKFLLPEMAARDDIRRRFEAEACAAASLSDPHAVAVFDTGEHEGRPYIVMERLPGETLADRIATAGPLDPGWVRRVAGEMLGALAAAHAAGLVHRDVKPGNILITPDDHAKISDFGIAKSVEGSSGDLDLTGTGQLLGTPAYLAPERLEGAAATARSDIYALGVVLYEALAGHSPFPDTTPMATARAIAAGDYQPLGEVRPELDPDLVAAVERAMATDPADRFDSATAMAAVLSGAGEPTLVGAAALGATSVMARPDIDDTQVVEAPVVAGRPRVPVPLALIVTLVFIALLVAWLNAGDRSAPEPSSSSSQPTTAPAPTSPSAALAAELRSFAGRLGPSDGARAGDLATLVGQVADQVEAGGGGQAATATMISAGAWRATGQLTDAAATTAVDLLIQVPGATVVTIPSRPAVTAPTASSPPTTAGEGGGGNGGRAGGGDDDDDDKKSDKDEGRGKGKGD